MKLPVGKQTSGKKTTKTKKAINGKKILKNKKKNLNKLSADEFFSQDFDHEENGNGYEESLDELASQDPELEKFLLKNGKKSVSNDEEMSVDGDEDDNETESEENDCQDDEEEEEEDEEDDEALVPGQEPVKITLKMLKKWEEELATDKTSKTVKCVMEAFNAAVATISKPADVKKALFKVSGSSVFNGIIKLCINHLPDGIKSFLKLTSDARFEANKTKKFPKIKNTMKSYFTNIMTILNKVASPDIQTVLLKHLHQIVHYAQAYTTLKEPLFEVVTKLLSNKHENIRVTAFLIILKIATTWKEAILDNLFKIMHMSYEENSKTVSLKTLAIVEFMKNSIVEIFMLDQNLAYNHAFMHIRQLALQLRNATTSKTKENLDAVYCWKFVNSLGLWSKLMIHTKKQSVLRSLLYPLVQIIIATIRLIPTSEYYPLRFHCVKILINISKETGVFIPVLPYLLEVLKFYDFNKKSQMVTKKPIVFDCLVKIQKNQLQESGLKDAIIDNVYQLILETAAKDSSAMHFPDMYINCLIELKAFLEKCEVSAYCKKIKQILDKTQDNSVFIENERNKIIVDLSDNATILNWEIQIRSRGTPMQTFYDNFCKKNSQV